MTLSDFCFISFTAPGRSCDLVKSSQTQYQQTTKGKCSFSSRERHLLVCWSPRLKSISESDPASAWRQFLKTLQDVGLWLTVMGSRGQTLPWTLFPVLLLAMTYSSHCSLVKVNKGLKVKRGQSTYLQEGDLQFHIPRQKDACKVEVVLNEPITQRVGKLLPQVMERSSSHESHRRHLTMQSRTKVLCSRGTAWNLSCRKLCHILLVLM